MEEATVLEHEDAATFGNHIYAFLHVQRVKRGRTTLEWFLPVLAIRFVEVKMEGEVRSLRTVRRFVGAIAMCCAVRTAYRIRDSIHTFEVFTADVLEKASPVIQPSDFPHLVAPRWAIPCDVRPLL
jgi:hypothetical protein